jgi:CIC family chloride channel protein
LGERIPPAHQQHTHYSLDLNKYLRKWIPLSVLIGVAGGFGGLLLQLSLEFVKSISYGIPGIPWYLVLLSPAVGALLAGLIMERFTPQTAGQGMSCVIDALNYRGGEIRPIASPVKLVVTALTVGSGGSGGREGPVAQICGGLATYLAGKLRLRREDLKIFVICAISAGTSAVFHAPIGGAIFALELPYKNDLEGRAIVPASLSSVAAYIVYLPLIGTAPVFSLPLATTTFVLEDIPVFLLIGLLAGGAGIGFVLLQKFVRSRFRAARIALHWKTALGGLMVGMVGLFIPQVMGLGLSTVQTVLLGGFTSTFLLVLIPMKIVATSITIGSYGSGGVFTTSLICGACLGGLVATAFGLQPAPLFMVVGMGAMVAGVTKTPIGAAIIVSEMAGGYHLFIPLVIASIVGYVATGNFAMYENQTTRGWMPVSMDDLSTIKVKDLMARNIVSLRASDTVQRAYTLAEVEPQEYYPVMDGEKVAGIVDREMLQAEPRTVRLGDRMSSDFLMVDPEMTARATLDAMIDRGIPYVVAADAAGIAGILSFEEILGVLGNICSPLDIARRPTGRESREASNGTLGDRLK